jgi:ubiquinone/menaquinone biosynthesis C-methylase UbiE
MLPPKEGRQSLEKSRNETGVDAPDYLLRTLRSRFGGEREIASIWLRPTACFVGGKMGRILTIERIPAPFASIYEKATRLVVEAYYAQVADEIVLAFDQGRLLDLGTGPGYLPVEIAGKAVHVEVVGVDLSRPLITMARQKALEAGLSDRVHFEVGNVTKLRFGEGSFDMVVSTGVLHMLSHPAKMLIECRRVLKPGGEAWVYDPARVCSQIDKKQWKASFTSAERWLYRLFVLFARINPPHVYSREQIVSMIEAASFRKYGIDHDKGEWKIKLTK